MIKAVDNFKKVKSYLERMGEPVILNRAISKEIIGRYNNILKDFTRTQVQDFLAVRADTSIVDDDNLLNEYYYCNLTYGQLKNKFGPTKMHDYHSYIKDATEMRNSESCDKRDMKVHWITGCSGGGKSAFAQFLAHEKYEDTEIAMGAEGDHMFDGYDLQPCFIMDEFRGSDMKFKSYLQLTDNHINSKMGARYHNVDFRNCKDMYITSIRTPEQCYMGMLNDGAEPRYQAYRRLGFQYYEIQITNYKEGQVCLVETENSDDTPEKVFRKTIVYKVKYSKDGAPEFIKLDEPIVVEGF